MRILFFYILFFFMKYFLTGLVYGDFLKTILL